MRGHTGDWRLVKAKRRAGGVATVGVRSPGNPTVEMVLPAPSTVGVGPPLHNTVALTATSVTSEDTGGAGEVAVLVGSGEGPGGAEAAGGVEVGGGVVEMDSGNQQLFGKHLGGEKNLDWVTSDPVDNDSQNNPQTIVKFQESVKTE